MDRRASARGNSSDRRQLRRPKAYLRGLVVSQDGKLKVECRVEDFAKTGARLVVNKGVVVPDPMYLITACKESGFEAVIIWAGADQYGVRFLKTFPLVNARTPESALLLPLELGVGSVVVALDGRLLEGAVHPFDLAICPWMVWLGEPVFDAVLIADAVEHVSSP